jgi:hypothetical protein
MQFCVLWQELAWCTAATLSSFHNRSCSTAEHQQPNSIYFHTPHFRQDPAIGLMPRSAATSRHCRLPQELRSEIAAQLPNLPDLRLTIVSFRVWQSYLKLSGRLGSHLTGQTVPLVVTISRLRVYGICSPHLGRMHDEKKRWAVYLSYTVYLHRSIRRTITVPISPVRIALNATIFKTWEACDSLL